MQAMLSFMSSQGSHRGLDRGLEKGIERSILRHSSLSEVGSTIDQNDRFLCTPFK